MVNWLIGVLFLLAVFVFLAILRVRHKMVWVIITFIVIFLIFSYVMVFQGKKLDLSTTDGVNQAVKSYAAWLGLVWDNTISITGNTVNMDWKTNETTDKKK
jgi:Na+-driven multidrug efflux pump